MNSKSPLKRATTSLRDARAEVVNNPAKDFGSGRRADP